MRQYLMTHGMSKNNLMVFSAALLMGLGHEFACWDGRGLIRRKSAWHFHLARTINPNGGK